MTSAGQAFDAIVIGAGAAGLMCALTAGQRGRNVVVLEHTGAAGAKILISGGGRCNFTNTECVPDRFLSANPHFCKSALARYTPSDFIAAVERHSIAYHEKKLGQLFCDGSARSIVTMLLDECEKGGVEIKCNQTVTDVSRGDCFVVTTQSARYTAPALVLATGGLSIPKMGATGFSYDVARKFGLRIVPAYPGLVPLVLSTQTRGFEGELAGVSLDAVTSSSGRSFRENILFTHRGLSGPAILQISSYLYPSAALTIDMLPGLDAAAFLTERRRTRAKASAQTVLSEVFPARLAEALASAYLPSIPIGNIPDRELKPFCDRLKAWTFVPDGTEGFAKAEVTCGGVDTRDLSSKTMAATSVPGLFVVGEAVDVTGWLGGYNFQWAWSSGWSAGQAI